MDSLDDENQKELKKVLDVRSYIKHSDDTEVFNAEGMKEIEDYVLEHTGLLNNVGNNENVVKFYYQILPDLINKKVEYYKSETNDSKGGYLKRPTPVFSFAYKLLKKYKEKNDDDSFEELKKYINQYTSDILKEMSDWSGAVHVFFDLKSFYETKETSRLDSNCSVNNRLNKMLNFLYKNRIIERLTYVTKFSVLKNEEFSCSWPGWFAELWRCLRDDFSTFWKRGHNITKKVILKKFLNAFDDMSVKLDQTNNESASITLSKLLTEVNEIIPKQETTNLKKI